MTKIKTEVTISAAHIVHTTDTPCQRLHGHNWRILVEIEGLIQEDGMIVDFTEIKGIINQLDHKLLLPSDNMNFILGRENECITFHIGSKRYMIPRCDVMQLPIPVVTAEYMAQLIAEDIYKEMLAGGHAELKVPQINVSIPNVKVTVYESEKSYAEHTCHGLGKKINLGDTDGSNK